MLSEAETRLKLSIVFTELTTSYGCWRYNVGEGYNDTLDDVKVSHWKQSVWVLRWGKIPFEWPVLALLRPGYTFLVLSRLVCKIISHSDLSWTIRIHILRKKVQGLWRWKWLSVGEISGRFLLANTPKNWPLISPVERVYIALWAIFSAHAQVDLAKGGVQNISPGTLAPPQDKSRIRTGIPPLHFGW